MLRVLLDTQCKVTPMYEAVCHHFVDGTNVVKSAVHPKFQNGTALRIQKDPATEDFESTKISWRQT